MGTHRQYRSYSNHGMLAATQAFIIYALLEYLDPDSSEYQVGFGYEHMPALLVSKIQPPGFEVS